MPPTLLCVVALAALLATSTLAVSSIRSSFMQVEADDTRCYFSYYGIFQNNDTILHPFEDHFSLPTTEFASVVYRGGWIDFYFFNLVESLRNSSGSFQRSPKYWLDSSQPQYVASSSTYQRTRISGAVQRNELVQVFNLTNGATVMIINSFFNTSTTLFFDLQEGRRNVSVTPSIAKMTIAVYDWPWIDKDKNKLEMEFGLNFNIFQQEDTSNPLNALFLIPEVIGADPGDPSPEFIIRGKISGIDYEVLLLKFGVDGNSSEVDMTINGGKALDGVRQFFDTTPPILKFNLTMRMEAFEKFVEYDPNFLVLLGEPDAAPLAADSSPVSAIVAAQLDTGAIAAIVVVAAVVVIVAIAIVIAIQTKKFGMRISVRSPVDETPRSTENRTKSTTGASGQAPKDHQQPGRWRAFSSEDVRNSTLRNEASS